MDQAREPCCRVPEQISFENMHFQPCHSTEKCCFRQKLHRIAAHRTLVQSGGRGRPHYRYAAAPGADAALRAVESSDLVLDEYRGLVAAFAASAAMPENHVLAVSVYDMPPR